jgi:hypothetical protein
MRNTMPRFTRSLKIICPSVPWFKVEVRELEFALGRIITRQFKKAILKIK